MAYHAIMVIYFMNHTTNQSEKTKMRPSQKCAQVSVRVLVVFVVSWYTYTASIIPTFHLRTAQCFLFEIWSSGASIPVPLACGASDLPIDLLPLVWYHVRHLIPFSFPLDWALAFAGLLSLGDRVLCAVCMQIWLSETPSLKNIRDGVWKGRFLRGDVYFHPPSPAPPFPWLWSCTAGTRERDLLETAHIALGR